MSATLVRGYKLHFPRSTTRNRAYCRPNQQLRPCCHYNTLAQGEFRLLRGLRARDGKLSGELKTYRIQSPETPPFKTISYTWGPPVFHKTISLGGWQTPIPDSLHPLLDIELQYSTDCWWWVDSLCINQQDDSEKSHQVGFMKEIFESAEGTTVWLGDQSEDSESAMNFLRYLGKDFWDDTRLHYSSPTSSWIQMLASRSGQHRSEWGAVERLFQRPWWRRVWTVQELIVSKAVIFRCGRSTLNGDTMRRAIYAIWMCHRASGVFRYDAQWNRNRIVERRRHAHTPYPSLTALLAYLGDHFSTDPRDRLYSLLGLVRDPELIDSPSYDITAPALYTKFVKSFMDKYRCLDIICFVTIFDGSGRSVGLLPSWVPDWSVPAIPLVAPLMVSQGARQCIGNLRPFWAKRLSAEYSASDGGHMRISFSRDGQELNCDGILLGTIDGLSSVANWMTPRTDEDRKMDALLQATPLSGSGHGQQCVSGSHSAIDITKAIMRCLVLNRQDHYFSHVAPEEEYYNGLRSLVDEATIKGGKTHTHFTSWFTANSTFKIRGTSLASIFEQASSERQASAQNFLGRSERYTFASRFHDTVVKMARRLVVTKNGLLAMVPRRSKRGDAIGILYGCSVPVVLRKVAGTDQYRLVGECYVDGYMNGEALSRQASFEETTFKLV